MARVLVADPAAPDPAVLAAAAAHLRAGGLVAFPTETVYGLGADARSSDAVAAIFAAKGRPADNPVIVHAADAAGAWAVTTGPTVLAARLAAAFWPGPLTLVLPAAAGLPEAVRAGLPSVAVRVPAHPVALGLLRAAGIPVAAPSANRSGRPSPTTAAHVLAELGDLPGLLILDGGPCRVGLESTVVDVRGAAPVILREGGVSREAIATALGMAAARGGTLGTDPETTGLPDIGASPGTRHRHYAPTCRVVVVAPGAGAEAAARIAADPEARPVGAVLAGTAVAGTGDGAEVADAARADARGLRTWRYRDADALGAGLYGLLRAAEDAGVRTLVVEGVAETGIGRAVMDRLRRAAAG
ncbi:MAG: L-threonylcarbamoyladenylate synthase [Chloroflexota bacterium]